MKKIHLITLGITLLSFVTVTAQKIEGRVFDKKTNEPIEKGEITFYNEKGDKLVTVYTISDGTYSFEPKRIGDVAKVTSSAPNYSRAEVLITNMDKGVIANFGLTTSNGDKHTAYTNTASTNVSNVSNESIPKTYAGNYDSSTLQSFYYDFNSSYLTPDNKASIDQIVAYMYNNRDAKVRVHVYFDTRGNVKYDEWLSQRRADRVVDYMISKGISPSRLMKWVETVSSNIATKGAYSRGGSGENRRCDFDII